MRLTHIFATSLVIFAMSTTTNWSQETVPPEFGMVRWERDHDKALARAQTAQKPVFALFQEVPGCLTCTNFGKGVLSHPQMVEAIETEFVPLAICNNKPGPDRKILDRYEEPSGNNPVVRFLDNRGQDVLPRQEGIWTMLAVGQRMIAALEAAKRPVPEYLRLAVAEAETKYHAKAVFAMHCYYEGEAKLGAVPGVLWTQAAFVGKQEVVEVTYDPRLVSLSTLVRRANELDCTQAVFVTREADLREAQEIVGKKAALLAALVKPAPQSEQKVSLYHSAWGLLPLTPLQATKVNAALRLKQDPTPWLTTSQKTLLTRIQAAQKMASGSLASLRGPEQISQLPEYQRTLEQRLAEVLDRK